MSSAREPSRTSLHKRGHPGEESLRSHTGHKNFGTSRKLLSSEVHIMWWSQEAQARRWESTFRVWQHYWMSDAGQKAVSRVLLPSHVSEPTRPSRLSQTSPTAASASGPINNLDTGHKVSLPKQLLNRPPTHAEKSARSTSLLQLAGVRFETRPVSTNSAHEHCSPQDAVWERCNRRSCVPCTGWTLWGFLAAIETPYDTASFRIRWGVQNFSEERGRKPQACTGQGM